MRISKFQILSHFFCFSSFPYESQAFPELCEKGAYTKDRTYSRDTITDIIEYAKARGIRYNSFTDKAFEAIFLIYSIFLKQKTWIFLWYSRVVAEFDTPGHTRSWGVSHPELLTACGGVYEGKYGPIDPSNENVYTFVQTLFAEVVNLFPDEYIHLGGDEGNYHRLLCWIDRLNSST